MRMLSRSCLVMLLLLLSSCQKVSYFIRVCHFEQDDVGEWTSETMLFRDDTAHWHLSNHERDYVGVCSDTKP